MRRDQLAHVLRAAATIVDEGDILVIGSQSILGSFAEDQLPDRAVASIEVDVAFFDDPDAAKADLVDAVIGELSPFHEQFGIYGQGVEVATAQLPPGWRDRLVSFERADTGAAHAKCLDPYDLVVSKLAAGREKDLEFAAALVDPGVLVERARTMSDGSVPPALARRVVEIASGYLASTIADPGGLGYLASGFDPPAAGLPRGEGRGIG